MLYNYSYDYNKLLLRQTSQFIKISLQARLNYPSSLFAHHYVPRNNISVENDRFYLNNDVI